MYKCDLDDADMCRICVTSGKDVCNRKHPLLTKKQAIDLLNILAPEKDKNIYIIDGLRKLHHNFWIE